MLTPHFSLPGTFARLGSVCHVRESSIANVDALVRVRCLRLEAMRLKRRLEQPKKTGHNSDFPGLTQAGSVAGSVAGRSLRRFRRRFFVDSSSVQSTSNPIRPKVVARLRALR
jgi:hypothetical protein